MLILKDSIEIKTTPEEVYTWFKNLDKNFVKLTGGMAIALCVSLDGQLAILKASKLRVLLTILITKC